MKDRDAIEARREAVPEAAPAPGPYDAALRHASAIGNQAFAALMRSQARVAREEADPFTDDPLADDFGDSSIRVKPGPVRTTLIRPQKLLTKDGNSFSQVNADPGAWAQGFLSYYVFRPEYGLTGGTPRYWLNDAVRDLTWILDRMVELAPLDNVTLTREQALAVATAAMPPGPAGPSATRTALYLSYSLVEAVHADPKTPTKPGTADPVGEQLALQYTLEVHPENKSGVEVSWVAQLGWAKDAGGERKLKVQQILSGPQAAYVFAFLDGALQITPMVQALAGVVRGEGTKDGIVKLRPATQVGGGGQIAYAVGDTGGHLQIGGQAAASWTDPQDAKSTFDYGAQIFLQWKF